MIHDANELQRSLSQNGFDSTEAFLIAVAVALTRNLALPVRGGPVGHSHPLLFREQLIDGLAVTFMFNIVNRIANAYDLQPEWVALRRTESIRRITRSFMAFGLPFQMPLSNDSKEASEPLCTHVYSFVRHFGFDEVSPVWQQLCVLPSIEVAIYQLLWVAVNCSDTDDELLDAVTQTCLGPPEAICPPKTADAHLSVWKQMFAEPYNPFPFEASVSAISTGVKLDIVFRVALLASIHKLNCSNVRSLVMQAFEG